MRKKGLNAGIRLTMAGAAGRMGQRILTLAATDARFQVVAGVERTGSPAVGTFVGGRAPIVADIGEVLPKTDVVIDFTHAEAVLRNAERVAKAKKALVVGTTGLSPAAVKKLQRLGRRIPLVFSPNMSVGVNLLFRLVQRAASVLPDADIEIVEFHHNQKKDAPSGTAMKLADVAAAASRRSRKNFVYGREGQVGERTPKEIGVLAGRAGDIVGDHTVYFAHAGERIELVHRAHSRDAFASGALTAAAWVARRRPGFYSMFDVLGLK